MSAPDGKPTYTHTITVSPGDTVIIKCGGMHTMAEQGKHVLFDADAIEEKLTVFFPALDP